MQACKFLARSESGAEGDVLKEIFTTIQKDADKLFKIIGEAYAVLSDANKVCSLSFYSLLDIFIPLHQYSVIIFRLKSTY